MWPPEILKLWPGQCRRLEVSFSVIEWGDPKEKTGEIWFWTRHTKLQELRCIKISVKCTRAESKPMIMEREIM